MSIGQLAVAWRLHRSELTIAAAERYLRTEQQPAAPMRPLYDARIEDLGPGDFLKVECAVCGHYELVPPIGLLQGWRLPPYMRVLALEPRFRSCRRKTPVQGRAPARRYSEDTAKNPSGPVELIPVGS